MKIAVLTLPLLNNYGGNLQAFAMMEMLKNLGYEPYFINLKFKKNIEFYVKYSIKKYLLFWHEKYKNPPNLIQAQDMKNFIDKYINPKTIEIFDKNELATFFNDNKFDAYVVGSDQVFRNMGALGFKDIYSLGFIDNNTIKIAYSASFGTDKYSGVNKDYHTKNLSNFKGISIREKSGIKICQNIFNVDAEHTLDPTMMIDKQKYIDMFSNIAETLSKDKIFAYILDKNNTKKNTLYKISKKLNKQIYEINDGDVTTPSIEIWLKSIHDSDLVITDSFHGCVFSIIFNKPFYCIINENRGADRFYSLLEVFQLKNRIIIDSDIDFKDIEWNKVNAILLESKVKSQNFIQEKIK